MRSPETKSVASSFRSTRISLVAAPKAETRVYTGPHREYVVEKGDTLSLISQAMNVPVRKIKEMNSLKNDNLRIGQKLMIPME